MIDPHRLQSCCKRLRELLLQKDSTRHKLILDYYRSQPGYVDVVEAEGYQTLERNIKACPSIWSSDVVKSKTHSSLPGCHILRI
jgi:hypothetical protein